MKRHTIWILAFLMIVGLLGFSSISLAEEGKWTRKADMPTPRSSLSSSVVNGKIYVIGGARFGKSGGGRIGESLSTVEEYDPATDKWTKKAKMPTKRENLSTSVVNGKIYAIGGFGGEFIVEEYDPVMDKWKKKAKMPTGRLLSSTSVVNGKIYTIGGFGKSGGGRIGESLSTVEEYDPATDKWTKKTDMPTARAALSTSVVNGKIYAIGGQVIAAGLSHNISSTTVIESAAKVEEYDPATDKWTKKADMPTARRSLSTSVINGKIYAIGGIGGRLIGGVNEGSSLSTVEEYDPVSDKWTKKTDMPTARRRLSTSVMSGRIYAIGGRNNEVLSTVEEYDPLD